MLEISSSKRRNFCVLVIHLAAVDSPTNKPQFAVFKWLLIKGLSWLIAPTLWSFGVDWSWPYISFIIVSRLKRVSSHRKAFNIALQTHKTQHIQPSGWKKKNKHARTWFSSKRKKEKFLTLSGGFLWSIASVYPSEIPTQLRGTLTHPLTLANPGFGSTDPSSSLSSRLS